MIKKGFTLVLMALALCVFTFPLAGCSGRPDIIIRGSTSVEPLMNALLDKYIELGNGHVRFDINAAGSAEGVTAAKQDKTHGNIIGMSSSVVDTNDAGFGNAFQLAWDAVVIMVSSQHSYYPNDEISSAEVFDIYTGKTTRFPSQTSGAISVNMKEAGSGTRDAFESTLKNASGKTLKNALADKSAHYVTPHYVASSTTQMITSCSTNVNAIGYTSLGAIMANSTIKALKVNGVEPNDANVLDGSYILRRSFWIVTGTAELTPATRDFINFLNSYEAQQVVLEEYFVRIADWATRENYIPSL